MKGSLMLALHAHLPFVRHPEHEEFLEEDWLFEAITETYLPLLSLFDGLKKDHIPFRLCLTLTPTLISMLCDPLLQERYLRHLSRLIDLAERECDRVAGDAELSRLAALYHWRYTTARRSYLETYGSDLVAAFRRFQDDGSIEILTCAATHAFLPLLASDQTSVRAQLRVARNQYEKVFEQQPTGIWLPECGYYNGLERLLKDEGISFFFIDSHGALHAEPRPRNGVYAPLSTSEGVCAFARDMDASRQVWSANGGYPGDPCYRDFYRDIGYDLDADYLGPMVQPTGQRKMTGIKYHRISNGGNDQKEVYDYGAALRRVDEQADDFVQGRIARFAELEELVDRRPCIVAPFDAELFGHWWFEGPEFLNAVLRKIHLRSEQIETITPPEYLRRHPNSQTARIADSSWGKEGQSAVWLNESNDWIYRHLHGAGRSMANLADRYGNADGVLLRRALNQAARELLLAQSSDWAFMMTVGAVAPYARKRTSESLGRFTRLHEQIMTNSLDEEWLTSIENMNNIFPDIDYRVFDSMTAPQHSLHASKTINQRHIPGP